MSELKDRRVAIECAGRRALDRARDARDWVPAGVTSPPPRATIEFELKSLRTVHRGYMTGAAYFDADEHVVYPLKMVRRWRAPVRG